MAVLLLVIFPYSSRTIHISSFSFLFFLSIRVGSSSHQSDNTSELIALGQSAGSVSGAYRGVGETTADLIALGDSIYKKSPTKRRPATLPASGVQLTRQERCSWTDGQADILASGIIDI